MPFNIQQFSSELNSRFGVLRTNKYRVIIGSPAGSSGTPLFEGTPDHSSFAQNAMIPGYQLLTHDHRRFTYGTNEARPFAPNFVPLQLVYAADGLMSTWQFFESWMQHIMPHDVGNAGLTGASAFSGGLAQTPYFLKYKSDYTTSVVLQIFGEDQYLIKTLVFREAFPINLNPIQISYEDQNNYAKFTVTLDYLDWYEDAAGTSSYNSTLNIGDLGNVGGSGASLPPLPTQNPG